jgi:hypothetical protein
MGFTEDEFYRTPMGKNNKDWVDNYFVERHYDILNNMRKGQQLRETNIEPVVKPEPTRDEVFRSVSGEYYDYLHNILAQKQQDYGPLNIALAPGGPLNGLLVRMNDKLQRLINLTYNSEDTPNHESLSDSYADLANYCVIAMMVLDGAWEGVPEEYLP